MWQPEQSLPFPEGHSSSESYVDELLAFITSSTLLKTLTSGVHILDVMTREPDLYTSVLPAGWREWFENVDVLDLLDLLMRDDVESLMSKQKESETKTTWKSHPLPPPDLLQWISQIRRLSLDRSFEGSKSRPRHSPIKPLSRRMSSGMKVKKLHEVQNFAAYVDDLMSDINESKSHAVSHVVDFGAGQNYLGRTLASQDYQRQVIAVESKKLNIEGARVLDVWANVAKKKIVYRNKKMFLATGKDNAEEIRQQRLKDAALRGEILEEDKNRFEEDPKVFIEASGRMRYVEHIIKDGDLSDVFEKVENPNEKSAILAPPKDLDEETGKQSFRQCIVDGAMVVSLHSCGNLLHHGVRSLVLNPQVKAIAMIGCCYNLATERLGPATFKMPSLRSFHPRLAATAAAQDPHGFPMSERFEKYVAKDGQEGIRLNITARMMAVQAPQNWTKSDCDSFFTRHFYRALLQRVFLDKGIIEKPGPEDGVLGGDDCSGSGTPIIIGTLGKACYKSFPSYVKGALDKLFQDPVRGPLFKEKMDNLTEAELLDYYEQYLPKKHELSILWSIVAFTAGVIESAIVVDRWLYLQEQPIVDRAWVQTVFDYKLSPRNLAVVGIKKTD